MSVIASAQRASNHTSLFLISRGKELFKAGKQLNKQSELCTD